MTPASAPAGDEEPRERLVALLAEPGERAASVPAPFPAPPGSVPRRRLSLRHDVFWLEVGATVTGPLCPGCWGRQGRASVMQAVADSWTCPHCRRIVPRPTADEGRRPSG